MTDRISTAELRKLLDNSRKIPMADYHLENIAPDLAAEVIKLREALEWYGEQTRLCRLVHSGGDTGRNALAADGGQRARAALNHKETDNGPV